MACGAPSSGVVSLSILKIVEGFSDIGWDASLNLSIHRIDEAMRFGYGMVRLFRGVAVLTEILLLKLWQRAYLGDPSYVDGLETYQSNMLKESTAAKIRGKVSDLHTLPRDEYNPDGLDT